MKPCRYIWCMPIIAHNGDVTVCCNDNFFELKLGNINEKPFEEIWTNEKATELRINHIKNNLKATPNEKCFHCRKFLELPEMKDEWIVDYLKTIHREDLIEPYLGKPLKRPIKDSNYIKSENDTQILLETSIYEGIKSGSSYEYNNDDNFNKGYNFIALEAGSEIEFNLPFPESKKLALSIHLAGLKETQAEFIINGISFGVMPINELTAGTGFDYGINISEESTFNEIKSRELNFKIKVHKGTICLLEKPIEEKLPETKLKFIFEK
jgi:radical SAM protein with 4Fe4S-binding SPASM domain